MKRTSLWTVAVAGLLLGCATLQAPLRSRAAEGLDRGLTALANGDYGTAHRELSTVVRQHAGSDQSERALLALATLELDPRNPARRIDAGTQLTAAYLGLRDVDGWTVPVAQTLYLLGLELGSAEERAQRAEREAAAAQRQLPSLPVPSVGVRVRSLEQERDRLAKRVETLETQLAEKEAELERIRKTIRP